MTHTQRAHEIEDLEADLRVIIRAMKEVTPNAYGIVLGALHDEFMEDFHLKVSDKSA